MGFSDIINSKLLNSLFRHLASEGLLRKGGKALIIESPSSTAGMIHQNLQLWHNNVIEVVMDYEEGLKGRLDHSRTQATPLSKFDDDQSEDVMDIVFRESVAIDVVRPIPATRSAIERLEKVTFENRFESIGECIICTEELWMGSEPL